MDDELRKRLDFLRALAIVNTVFVVGVGVFVVVGLPDEWRREAGWVGLGVLVLGAFFVAARGLARE